MYNLKVMKLTYLKKGFDPFMRQVLNNAFRAQESLVNHWPQVSLLHPNSINLICDASSLFAKVDNTIHSAVVASSTVLYDTRVNEFVNYSLKPVTIKSHSVNFSEQVSVVVGLENLYMSGIKQSNHTVLNVFTDNIVTMRNFLPLFANVKAMRWEHMSPEAIMNSILYSSDMDWLIVYYLVALNIDANIYHIKAHTNNLAFIDKDFIINNGIKVNKEELIYLSSVHAMVDSLASKIAQNMI